MIGKLSGKVDSIFSDSVIIDVGGVGYKVYCSSKTSANFAVDTTISLLIETHVREDNIQLFGFVNLAEKQMFLLLTTVKGIGTKVGLGILSHFSPDQISQAISANDKTVYKSLPGVGLKTWERVIIELKDKVVCDNINVTALNSRSANVSISTQNSMISDATSALINLGIHRAEANRVVQEVLKDEPTINLSSLIRLSLKQFAR